MTRILRPTTPRTRHKPAHRRVDPPRRQRSRNPHQPPAHRHPPLLHNRPHHRLYQLLRLNHDIRHHRCRHRHRRLHRPLNRPRRLNRQRHLHRPQPLTPRQSRPPLQNQLLLHLTQNRHPHRLTKPPRELGDLLRLNPPLLLLHPQIPDLRRHLSRLHPGPVPRIQPLQRHRPHHQLLLRGEHRVVTAMQHVQQHLAGRTPRPPREVLRLTDPLLSSSPHLRRTPAMGLTHTRANHRPMPTRQISLRRPARTTPRRNLPQDLLPANR